MKLLLFLYISFVSLLKGEDGCRELRFLDCEKDKALTGHVIKTIRILAPGLEECQHQCFMESRCVSYNLGPAFGVARSCELNDEDHVECPDNVKTVPGAEYCPIRNPCSSNPCPKSLSCKPDFDFNTFRCLKSLLVDVESRGLQNFNGSQRKSKLMVDGTDYCCKGRGHNIAALHLNGTIISVSSFDTYKDRGAGQKMSTYIYNLPNNSIVLVAVHDSGSKFVQDAYEALLSIGAKYPLNPNGFRASWCLIGYKGGYRSWIAQDQKDRFDVIAKVSSKIPIVI